MTEGVPVKRSAPVAPEELVAVLRAQDVLDASLAEFRAEILRHVAEAEYGRFTLSLAAEAGNLKLSAVKVRTTKRH
jgi:hypothetical protein